MRSGVLGRPAGRPTWVNQQEGCARSLEELGAVAERTVKELRKCRRPVAGSRSGGRNAGIHCGVEVTELSTNKQHSLTHTATCVSARFLYWVLYVGVRASERESACVLLKVIVISATGHGVCARTCNSEGSSFGTIATALGQAEAGSGEEKTAGVRRACTRKER